MFDLCDQNIRQSPYLLIYTMLLYLTRYLSSVLVTHFLLFRCLYISQLLVHKLRFLNNLVFSSQVALAARSFFLLSFAYFLELSCVAISVCLRFSSSKRSLSSSLRFSSSKRNLSSSLRFSSSRRNLSSSFRFSSSKRNLSFSCSILSCSSLISMRSEINLISSWISIEILSKVNVLPLKLTTSFLLKVDDLSPMKHAPTAVIIKSKDITIPHLSFKKTHLF